MFPKVLVWLGRNNHWSNRDNFGPCSTHFVVISRTADMSVDITNVRGRHYAPIDRKGENKKAHGFTADGILRGEFVSMVSAPLRYRWKGFMYIECNRGEGCARIYGSVNKRGARANGTGWAWNFYTRRVGQGRRPASTQSEKGPAMGQAGRGAIRIQVGIAEHCGRGRNMQELGHLADLRAGSGPHRGAELRKLALGKFNTYGRALDLSK